MPVETVIHLLVVLAAGFASGAFCRWLRISPLIGYLVIGALIGDGGFGLLHGEPQMIELMARGGILLLLFAIGLEFSPDDLRAAGRPFLLGGAVQMLAVAVPVALIALRLGLSWQGAVLVGAAVSLSSTVLVFRALGELGAFATESGRRAIDILLFQDIMLVPLLLLLPMLGGESLPHWTEFGLLAGHSLLLIVGVLLLRQATLRLAVPLLAKLRSVELVVLFSLLLLIGVCLAAVVLGLPPTLGALAAGIALSGNRLTGQVDALLLPFRETFAAVFFISLGLLLRPELLRGDALLLLAALAGVLLVKLAGGALGLRAGGLPWRQALGMGLGLAQMGEFSFVLVLQGTRVGILEEVTYQRVLVLALATLVLTPLLLRRGLRFAPPHPLAAPLPRAVQARQAVVVGVGPVGRQAASRLETGGINACLIDQSPVNLHPFAQLGFRTLAGDGTDPDVLEAAGLREARLLVATVPDDMTNLRIVRAARLLNPDCRILARCRYSANVAELLRAGAQDVLSEEVELARAVGSVLDTLDTTAG